MTGTLRRTVSSYRAPKTQIPSKSVSFKELYGIKLNENSWNNVMQRRLSHSFSEK